MESLSSDDSCDSEMKNMKSQLSEFGLDDENLTKEEMADLLKAFNNSKSTEKEEELLRQKLEEPAYIASPKQSMKRRYLNVKDRRMPWSVLPSTLTPAEKARTLAVYIKFMTLNNYRHSRESPNFESWPPPLQIYEEAVKIMPLRSTRSGRTAPIYAGFDDDSSDLDFVITKPKKRKISNSDNASDSGNNKSLSLKRKPSKDENARPVKEPKISTESIKESASSVNNVKNIFTTLIED